MASDLEASHSVSAAFFCPQSRAPDEEYLAGLHSFLCHNQYGQLLLKEISELDKTWKIFSDARPGIEALSQAPKLVEILQNWARDGESCALARARSGIVALPLLVILEIGQYLRYLEFHKLSHLEFLAQVQDAGVQGYCGGLPSAIAIACAKDEWAVVTNTNVMIRVLLGVGAYGEAADDTKGTGSTTLAFRLKYEGQGDELTQKFPGTHVSAITDPRSVSIVGPAAKLDDLYVYARELKIQVQKMDIRGKVHNPENKKIATDLCHLCNDTPCLQLPEASSLRVPVRSNITGERLHSGSLIKEVVTTILASRCDWFQLLNEVAGDLNASKRTAHKFLIFGLNDCVPMSPFHKYRLQATKSETHGLIRRVPKDRDGSKRLQELPMFQDSAIAVVGASCRLPGANNLEELWNLMANGTDCHQEISTVKDRFDLYGSFRASQCGNFANERKFYGNFIDDVRRFDNSFFGMNAREAANLDPQQRILLELSFEALDASGYLTKHRRESGDNVGCFIGASLVEYLDNTNAHGSTAYTSTGTIRAFLCGRLSYCYGWCGPSEVIDTACSSSLVAINRACKAIQSGECNMALAGGVNIITGINNYLDLGKAGFLSTTGQCKPFDKSADGYCRSDGAGLVVLKTLKQAINDGDDILGIIPGIATNQGGLSASITVPHSAAQQGLYRSVIKQSGLQPEQITYVEAHGTGTQAGDPLEMESIRLIFGNPSRRDKLHVGSIKGNLGHCETAAGVASLLKVLAMIKHGQIPPQANHQQLNPKISSLEPDGLGIAKNLRAWDVPFRAALVNSYGAAGSNCALLCCEMPREGNQEKKEAHELTKQSTKPSVPIFLSATSPQSLLDQARVLGLYLRQQSTNLDIESVSFTLNEKRQRHKYFMNMRAKDITDLADQLLSVKPAAISEVPHGQKHVILSFSGQNNDRVALDKAFYDAYPVFRTYIETCDKEIRDLGFHSIIPAIFQEEAIEDVAILQCSIFALQYACAMCWINAGLKTSMVVGHSLGELTALATSGTLSLSDTVKLVATRGHLIQTKWGTDKGAMLALNCDTDDFENIAAQIKSSPEGGKLEIACYNAPTSLVAVGTSATIDAVESLISTTPSFQKIKFKRVQTSHGFHSALVEPILGGLQSMNESLSWNEPKINLELCAASPLRSMQNYSISKHAREPVYFSDAIKRIEEKLGASNCIWLEAGIDTPIIPMVRKATRKPEAMSFHPMRSHDGRNSADTIGDVVFSLWNSGVFLTHWSHLSDHAGNRKHVWLPPYQFEKIPHWRENIDRTIEMRLLLSEVASSKVVENILPPPAQLVSRKDPTSTDYKAEFLINTQSHRYRKIVGGHAVRGRPLCPASMYMECVVMAIQLSCKDTINASLLFENLDFHSALSLYPEGEVVIQLDEIISGSSWRFNIRSSTSKGPRPKQTSHGNGIVTLTQNSMLNAFQRLVEGSTERLKRKEDAEKLMSKRAYGLFSLVVDYDHFFRGIRSITIDEWEAIATITVPENQPSREESTSWSICDTVTIDAFIQVVGLLMNSSDAVLREEVMVMVGIERAVISPACRMDDSREWTVYAKFCFTQDEQPLGDVFVFSLQGDLVAMLCGCKFTKLPILKLEKALDLTNSKIAQDPLEPSSHRITIAESDTSSGGTITPAATFSIQCDNDEALRELVAGYIGVDVREIGRDTNFADLGLDSLASVELVGELSSKFGLAITSDELVTSCLADLDARLGIPTSVGLDPKRSEVKIDLHSYPEQKPLNIPLQHETKQKLQKFLRILIEVSGAKLEDIEQHHLLSDLGVDSLSSVDLKQELEESFAVRLDDSLLECTVKDLLTRLHIDSGWQNIPELNEEPGGVGGATSNSAPMEKENIALPNPFNALKQSDTHFDASANAQGFRHYWSDVATFQDKILLAYIVECFRTLGVNLTSFPPGSSVPQIPYLTQKYDKLVPRLWSILQKHDIIDIEYAEHFTRTSHCIDNRSSSQLIEEFRSRFPHYNHETNLINLTGPRLADCLSGHADSVSIMFGSLASLQIMENFYGQSPMMSTLTEQLVIFLTTLLRGWSARRPIRILEVGAGTGGTTKRLAEALESAGITAEYTFTDIASSLVAKAKNKFKKYPWIKFATFNLEKEVPETFRNQFDIVISANCVHATTDRIVSCRRLKDVLTQDGFIVLSEVTRIIDWYDICFGLLDGWWLAEGRTAYPLQPAEAWMSTFNSAGFASYNYSQGPTPEANSQQLLVACCKQWRVSTPTQMDSYGGDAPYQLETVVYKELSDVQIHADIFLPRQPSSSPLPIALMIHGGGHMTLSRKAVRPMQTQYLLSNGYLPVSIDYRLCPEVNLIDGPMADVCDAYRWVRNSLPEIAAQSGIVLDPEKVVVIGWSTGGQLAMSIGWMARSKDIPPPTAVLSFYAPVDFQSRELDKKNRPSWLPDRRMSIESIISALPETPITNYDSARGDKTGLGWVRPGEPRSELVLSLFKEGIGLPLLLNGLPNPGTPQSEWFKPPPSELVSAISPLAQLRRGAYDVPTFIIHGTNDQIAPFQDAERFVAELKKQGITYGFLPLKEVDHIHDLTVRPGSKEWKEMVEPGYKFLFEIVRNQSLDDY